MNVRYLVTLAAEEKSELEAQVSGGTGRVRHVTRAQILLAAHVGVTDEQIARSVRVSVSTVYRVKRRFVEGGVEHALHDRQRPGASRKLPGKQEALLAATAWSTPPKGRARWTLQLLADELVRLAEHEDLSRTAKDFAVQMRALVDVHYPEAETIRVVLDNLSTHSPVALYEAFPPQEARRILKNLEFHFVPKHASWLNMVEIEISVLTRQCLDRRIGTKATLKREMARWERTRNKEGARVRWRFTIDSASTKLGRAYPQAQAAVAAAA